MHHLLVPLEEKREDQDLVKSELSHIFLLTLLLLDFGLPC